MQIDIQSLGFTLTHALREYTGRRLRFALVHAGDHVRRVTVRLYDVNGPRGGIDKRCRIQVMLNGLAAVVIEGTEADLYLAIDRAADRIGRTVMRGLAHHNARAPTKTQQSQRPLQRTDTAPMHKLNRTEKR